MNRQYTLVNECLHMLQKKSIKPIQKLHVEVQLCKLKRLLLEHDMDEATGESFIVSLMEVCREISRVEGGEIPSAAFEEVKRGLQRIIDVLAGEAGTSATQDEPR